MKSRMEVCLLMAPLLLSCFVLTTNTVGADYILGVKTDDWVKYKITNFGNDPYGQKPDWTMCQILSAAGKFVSVRVTHHLKNGTDLSYSVSFQLDSERNSPGFVIPANCSVGDKVNAAPTAVTISSQDQKTYAGATRTVLIGAYASSFSRETFIWDGQTGFLLEMVYADPITANTEYIMTAAETNLWSSGFLSLEWWVWVVIITFVVAIVSGSILVFRRKRKLKPEVAKPEPALPPPPSP